MGFIKASFQNVVRRFAAADGLSVANLKTKLKEVFPELSEQTPDNIQLYYRDSDNDLVTVSSDGELRAAEENVGPDRTLKLLLSVSEEQKSDEEEDLFDVVGSIFSQPFSLFSHVPSHTHSLFPHHTSSFFGDPFSFPSFPTWSDRRKMLERHEERIRRQRMYEENMRKAHLESIKKMKERAEEEKKKAVEEKGKSPGAGEIQRKSSKDIKPVLPVFPPGWHVTPYGTWEPMVYQTPYGTRRVWGPWGYTASYGGDEEMESEEKKEEKMEEEPAKEEVPPVEEKTS